MMTYFSGNTANTATPGKDFMEFILHPNLLTSGFTYVEEVIASGTTRIYKSSAAANGIGDWYFIVTRSSDSITQLATGVCEEYDSATHIAKRWAPSSIAAGLTFPADRSHPTVAGTAPVTAVGANHQSGINLATATHSYILSLHPKRIVVSTRIVSSEMTCYLGLYESVLYGIPNHFPLMMCGVSTGSTLANTLFSREPGTAPTTTLMGSSGNGNGSFGSSLSLGLAGLINTATPVAFDGFHTKPTVVRTFTPSSNGKSGTGRGLFYGLYTGGTGVFSWGDTLNIDWEGTPVVATCVHAATARVVDQAY